MERDKLYNLLKILLEANSRIEPTSAWPTCHFTKQTKQQGISFVRNNRSKLDIFTSEFLQAYAFSKYLPRLEKQTKVSVAHW